MWLLCMFIDRCWRVHFAIKLCKRLESNNWRQHINPVSIEGDWYFSRRKTMGNKRWNFRLMWAAYAVVMTIELVVESLSHQF